MTKNFQRGFTLIELLVVIAIIGILASVVLASLNSARDSGSDAATQSNLNNIRAQAELVYSQDGNSYDAVCEDPNVARAVDTSGGTCVDTATGAETDEVDGSTSGAGWAVEAALSDGTNYYCADHTGNGTTTSGSTIGADDSVCG